jgi:hypothetical protein
VSDPFVVIMNNKIRLNPRLHMNGVYTNFVSDELINDTSALLSQMHCVSEELEDTKRVIRMLTDFVCLYNYEF